MELTDREQFLVERLNAVEATRRRHVAMCRTANSELEPGGDPGGLVITIVLGVAGAFVGGFIGSQLGLGAVTGFNLGSFALATGGAILLLIVYRLVR